VSQAEPGPDQATCRQLGWQENEQS